LPFRGTDLFEVLQAIKTLDPCPPRQLDDAIPRELERICLKALAKLASDRYTIAKDMADDLRHFLDYAPERAPSVRAKDSHPETETVGVGELRDSAGALATIVPKGLRSFDANDADFFLGLLPGPRDRAAGNHSLLESPHRRNRRHQDVRGRPSLRALRLW